MTPAMDGVAGRDTSFLNVFRGCAALWVVLAHCAIWSGSDMPDLFEPKKAVDLFMVVSGFLMMYTIDRAAEREIPGRWRTWRRFYLRRYFRIAPAYYVALLLAIPLWPLLLSGAHHLQAMNPARWGAIAPWRPQPIGRSALGLASHMSFLFGLLPSTSYASGLPDWSLSLEMQFYAVFPLIYLAVRRRPFLIVLFMLAAACVLFTHGYDVGVKRGWLERFQEPSLLPFKLPLFLVGMLAYEGGRRRKAVYLAAAALLLLVACRGYGLTVSSLLMVAVAGVAGLWFLGLPAWLAGFMHSRAVTVFSDASYSVYLLHGMLIDLLGWPVLAFLLARGVAFWAAELGMTVAVVGAVYPLAWCVYRYVEKPGIALGKRLSHTRQAIAPPMA